MFRIECFCDDKVLAKIMWALEALHVYNLSAKPVVDSRPKPNGLVPVLHQEKPKRASPKPAPADRPSAKETPALFAVYCKKKKLREVKASDVKAFAVGLGFAKGSYSHILDLCQLSGLLKKIPGDGASKTRYQVTVSKMRLSRLDDVSTHKLPAKSESAAQEQ